MTAAPNPTGTGDGLKTQELSFHNMSDPDATLASVQRRIDMAVVVAVVYLVSMIVPIVWLFAIPWGIANLVMCYRLVIAAPILISPSRCDPGKSRAELVALAVNDPNLALIFFFQRARALLWISNTLPIAVGCIVLLCGKDWVIYYLILIPIFFVVISFFGKLLLVRVRFRDMLHLPM